MNNAKLILSIVFLSIVFLIGYGMFRLIYGDNIVNNDNEDYHTFYIKRNDTYNDVSTALQSQNIIKNHQSFEWLANKMNYANHVYPGKYHIENTLNTRELITKLRSGDQEEVSVTINHVNRPNDICRIAARNLDCDSVELRALLRDNEYLAQYERDSNTVMASILANTYKFRWTTNAAEFLERMDTEFNNFWNSSRLEKANNLNITPIDAVILASIVEKESNKKDEYGRIAGVYLNRLQQNWPLQADPTVKYALRQPELKRVLTIHTEVDSKYNTYKYPGLPPGPIGLPMTTTIDAVLNAEDHSYMYFCARDDFSGYHDFAKNLREHNKNARAYQRALNERGIR